MANKDDKKTEEKTSKESEKEVADKLDGVSITSIMEQSYLDYSMSVIVSRALPDVRDGLKPVHRRILYAMNKIGLTHNKGFRKSATVVGEVLGKYHPHGDVAVYDTLVRLAQDFSMRYPLVNGHGNFGSIDGDSPAAMRYTECKMEKIASEILKDIKMNTVDFVDNYDGTTQEPKVLPSRLPNLLLNGTLGIAVGMATDIPPHNLGEVVDGCISLLNDPEISLDKLMEDIPGPDFPTGGNIYGGKGLQDAYSTGKGSITVRGEAKIEEAKRGKHKIIITEIPYQVNKADMIKKIADLVKDKKIKGISDIRDESGQEGMRVMVELKKNTYPKKVLNALFKYTRLQDSYHFNMLALVDGIQPRVLNLKEILQHFLDHRQVVIVRRSEYELKKIEARLHILDGLLTALDKIDAVIAVIKKSENKKDAGKNLVSEFDLTPKQAEAILEMQLSQLSALEQKDIKSEYENKKKRKKELEELLGSDEKIKEMIEEELEEVKEEYNDERRSQIYKKSIDGISQEDMVANKPVIVTLTKDNYIKRLPISTYKSQARGGKGVVGMVTKKEDVVKHMLVTNTHSNLLFFTDKGKVYQSPVYEIPQASRRAKGQAIVNILEINPKEKVTGVIDLSKLKEPDTKYLLMATENGRVKKTEAKEYENVRRSGLIAMRVKENDRLRWVETTSGKDQVLLVTAKGKSIRFKEGDVRPMARNTLGVKGINLAKNDKVVGMGVIASRQTTAEKEKEKAKKEMSKEKGVKEEDVEALIEETGESKKGLSSDLLIVTANGYGKRTQLKDYSLQNRGGKGIKAANIKEKTGDIVQMETVPPRGKGDLVLVSAEGKVIRIPLTSAKKMGRSTQGVRLMKLNANDKVASLTLLAEGEKS